MEKPVDRVLEEAINSLRKSLTNDDIYPESMADDLEIVLRFVEEIPSDRLQTWHTVTAHSTGWHMAHPVTCALDECAFDGLAQAEWTEAPTAEGVWQWHDFEDEPWDWTEALPKL